MKLRNVVLILNKLHSHRPCHRRLPFSHQRSPFMRSWSGHWVRYCRHLILGQKVPQKPWYYTTPALVSANKKKKEEEFPKRNHHRGSTTGFTNVSFISDAHYTERTSAFRGENCHISHLCEYYHHYVPCWMAWVSMYGSLHISAAGVLDQFPQL